MLTLAAGSLTAPAHAEPVPAELACPDPVPVASLTEGVTGTGYTVARGSTPEPFDVEVLGVLDDGIGADRDLIMIKVSDQPGRNVISQGGGIWAGMSGSPVYVDGKLLGAVAYGFSLAPSPIGGVTPAADMQKVLNLPRAGGAAARVESTTKETVALSKASRLKLAAQAEVAAPQGSLRTLPTPVSVSGLSSQRINALQAETDAAGRSLKLYAGSRASTAAAEAPTARPQPGGNFAAALSYGDVTAAGFGTTTAVCDDQALAFGHPFLLRGPASYAANDGNAVAIIKDDTFGSFKLANMGAAVGTVDQDRLAAIRADLTRTPDGAVVTANTRNLDTGATRTGTTRIVDQQELPGLMIPVVWNNYDATFDEWGDGQATTNWTITGTRAGGKPLTVYNSDRWSSRSSLTDDPAFDLAYAADALVNQEFEPVTITGVEFNSAATSTYDSWRITKTEVSVDDGRWTTAKSLRVAAGAKLRVRVTMTPFQGSATKTTTLSMTVPKSAKGKAGALSVAGGLTLKTEGSDEEEGCLFTEEGCVADEDGSLDTLVKGITSAPRNDDVVAQLALESGSGSVSSTKAVKRQPRTVTGQRSISVTVR